MTPWIQNVSMSDIRQGFHIDPGFNSMLIQIVDPAMEFPTPMHKFKEVHQFEFLDVEEKDEVEAELEAAPVKNYALKTPATAKSSKAEKFDALFEDEDDNDLPF